MNYHSSALLRPDDAWQQIAYAVQIKGYRTKQEYFTLAVFRTYSDAYDFLQSFPFFPAGSLRILDSSGIVIYRKRFAFAQSKHRTGSTAWWMDQSKEITQRIHKTEPKLPRFSVMNIARKSLRSFIK